MNGYLIRQYYPSYTMGDLYIAGEQFAILERPWLDNRSNVSCIPTGVYEAKFLPRSGSGKYTKVWHLMDTAPRTGVLIHSGNLVRHSRGCPLIGSSKGTLGGQPAVLGSKSALRKLRKITSCEDFVLHIIGEVPNVI